MWHPVKTSIPTTHYGKFIALDETLGAKAIFGYGSCTEVNALSEKLSLPGYVFDYNIDVLPECGPLVKYLPESIGPEDKGPFFTLDKHRRQFGFENENIILKMNVAGREWDVLKTCDLSRVVELIIELNEVDLAPREVLDRLHNEFHLVHVSGKEPHYWMDRASRLPRYLQCTFVRKDLAQDVTPTDEDGFWLPPKTRFSFVTTCPEHVTVLKTLMTPDDEIVATYEEATKDYIMVFIPGDIIPVDIISSLEEAFTKHPDVDRVATPILYNGLAAYEARISKRASKSEKTIATERPIFNMKRAC